jgi:hypothetical protein
MNRNLRRYSVLVPWLGALDVPYPGKPTEWS